MSVALDVISRFLFENDMLIYLVVFGRTEYLTSRKLFSDVQEYIDDVYAASHYHRNAEARRRELWQVDEEAAADLYDSAIHPDAIIVGSSKPDWSKVLEEADEGFSEALCPSATPPSSFYISKGFAAFFRPFVNPLLCYVCNKKCQ